MSNTPGLPHQAALFDAYQATLDQFPRSPSPHPSSLEKASTASASSPLRVTTEAPSDHQAPCCSPLAEIPAYQPTKVGEEKITQAELFVLPSQSKDEKVTSTANPLAPNIDPALMNPQFSSMGDISPVVQGKRPMLPALHRLNTNVSVNDNSAPSSVISSSPETSFDSPFGLYSNYRAQGSFDDLSRVNSRTDLSTTGAQKGTIPSASSDDDLVNGKQDEGGVPGPKAKKSHARKQPQGHIKRARNAFILFRKHITDSGLIPPTVESKHQNISVVAAKMWREAPQDVRHKFQEQARIEKEEHQRKYPNYRYQPVFRRNDIIRRRVRKDKTEDEKVEAVAEAMIKGKAGEELVEEVKEQIVKSAAASEDESDGGGKRRRRREDGELSKGAIRAQRAQNRAKAMRQNLLGSNLLGSMMYQQNYQPVPQGQYSIDHRIPTQAVPQHPGAQYHVAQHPSEYGMPVGYDTDGRPVLRSYHNGFPTHEPPQPHPHPHPHPAVHEDMYRLPPIQHAVGPNMWDSHEMVHYPPPRMDHWPEDTYGQHQHQHSQTQNQWTPEDEGAHQSNYFEGVDHYPVPEYEQDNQYRFPPMLEEPAPNMPMPMPHSASGSVDMFPNPNPNPNSNEGNDSSWMDTGPTPGPGPGPSHSNIPEAPSGHVFFNERLFDGALGSAPVVGRREEDEGLGAFDEAVAQANDTPEW